jgi:bifunctional enzyme CysN/CysC
MIVTAIDLSQDDLDILKTVIDEDKVHVVWVGEKVTTDINYDLHLGSHNTINEGVVLIKHLLQTRGIIFTA